MRVRVIGDSTRREGGYLTELLRSRGADLAVLDREALPAADSLERADLLVLLGSRRSAHDPAHVHDVMAESHILRESVAAGTPAMAIGFGAQLMARALGGTSWATDAPEVGHQRIDTVDEVLCPPGPWPQFHQDTFAPPQTARVLGSTWHGPQCFVEETHGSRAIAWQFHPEVTPQTYSGWVAADAALVRAHGVDPDELVREARRRAPAVRAQARALFDAALTYLQVR